MGVKRDGPTPGEWMDAQVARMDALAKSDDTEGAHAEADAILVSVLRSLQLRKLTVLCDAYDDVDKWFA